MNLSISDLLRVENALLDNVDTLACDFNETQKPELESEIVEVERLLAAFKTERLARQSK